MQEAAGVKALSLQRLLLQKAEEDTAHTQPLPTKQRYTQILRIKGEAMSAVQAACWFAPESTCTMHWVCYTSTCIYRILYICPFLKVLCKHHFQGAQNGVLNFSVFNDVYG